MYGKLNTVMSDMGDKTGNDTVTEDGRELSLINTGSADLTLTILGKTVTIIAGGYINQLFQPFSEFTVAATDTWSYIVSHGRR